MNTQDRNPLVKSYRLNYLAYIGFAIIFIAVLLVPRLTIFSMPFERDEGEYAYSAWILSHNIAPYAHSFIQKPPLILYVYLLAQTISADGYWAPRLLSLLFSGTTCGLLFLLLYRQKRIIAAVLCPVFLAAAWTAPFLTAYVANVEIFLLLPLVGLYAWYAWPRKSPPRYRDWMLGGFLAATVNLFKPVGAVVTIAITALALVQYWRFHRSIKKCLVHDISALGAGAVAAILVSTGYFLLHGGWKELLEYSFVYNLYYSPPGSESGFFSHFLHFIPSMAASWWPLFAAAALSFAFRSNLWKRHWCLLGASVISVVAGPFGHYWLLVTPFLALLAGLTIEEIIRRITGKGSAVPSPILLLAVCAAAVPGVMLLPVYGYLSLPDKDMERVLYGTKPPFLEAPEVARVVASLTNDRDRIFVAGSEPEIYFYSRRIGSTPFVITYPMTGSMRFSEEYQRKAVQDLVQNPPEVIVYCRYDNLERRGYPRELKDYLGSLINRNYYLVGAFMQPSKVDPGGWKQGPLIPAEMSRYSLLVLKKAP